MMALSCCCSAESNCDASCHYSFGLFIVSACLAYMPASGHIDVMNSAKNFSRAIMFLSNANAIPFVTACTAPGSLLEVAWGDFHQCWLHRCSRPLFLRVANSLAPPASNIP